MGVVAQFGAALQSTWTQTTDFFTVVIHRSSDILGGLSLTLQLTAWAAVLGFALAVPLVVGVLYGNGVLKQLCKGFITVVRGTPMLVQLFFIFYGLPSLGVRFNPMTAAVIGFVINSSAYQAEYLKGGFLAISREQLEASYSIGLSKMETVRLILFPQALRFAIPALSNEIVYLIQYTSVAYIIAVPELFAQMQFLASDKFMYLPSYLFVGAVYLILIFIVNRLTAWVEKKLSIPGFDLAHLK